MTRGVGEGRWSWLISASLAGLFTILIFKPDKILTSGGPASAHLAGLIVGKVFALPVIVELQDPLSGEGIGRNSQARGWLYRVEKYILKNATKTVYVTKLAADFARREFGIGNVQAIYPGSKNFGLKYRRNKNKSIRIIHLGSLYSTRNFDSIIKALDILIVSKKINTNEVELINLGHVSEYERSKLSDKLYVKILSPIPRKEALKYASECDISLLIQHIDKRSNVTIPYKTYDYLNIGNHIMGLLNSEELKNMMVHYGHVAIGIKDTDSICQYILEIKNRNDNPRNSKQIDHAKQSKILVDLS